MEEDRATEGEVIEVNDKYFTNPGLSDKTATGMQYMQTVPNMIAQSTGRLTVAVAGDPDRINEFLHELSEFLQDILNREYTDLYVTETSRNTFSSGQRFSLPYQNLNF